MPNSPVVLRLVRSFYAVMKHPCFDVHFSGWDYSSRWLTTPIGGNAGLRTLNVKNIVPVDLNSILCERFDLFLAVWRCSIFLSDKNHILLAQLYGSSNKTAAAKHQAEAATLHEGILDLFWNSTRVISSKSFIEHLTSSSFQLAFYDFNLLTNTRNDVFSTATFYPFWSGIIPNEVLTSSENAFSAFSSVNMVVNRYNGTFPTTFIDTGLQW